MRACCKSCANLAKVEDDKAVCLAGSELVHHSSSCIRWAKSDRPQALRLCTRCGRLLPLSHFYTNPRRSDGYELICKSCVKAKSSESYRRRNPVVKTRGRKEVDLVGVRVGDYTAVEKVRDSRCDNRVARIYRWISVSGDEVISTKRDLSDKIARRARTQKKTKAEKMTTGQPRPYAPENPEQFRDEFMMITKMLI